MAKVLMTLFALTAVCQAAAQTGDLERFPAAGPPGRVAPFSDAVRVDDLLFVSGKLGTAQGELVSGGIAAETRQALENIKASLELHGSSMEQVAKCTVFLADMAEFGEMNEVYVSFFADNLPARSAFGVNGLAFGARVEIECIAAIPQD